MSIRIIAITLLFLVFSVAATDAGAEAIIADHSGVSQFEEIPDAVITYIQSNYEFFYGHTSHGSQIMTGLDVLYDEDPFYAEPPFTEYGDDLGHNGDVSWVPPTTNYLDSHPECNVVMWSWCGGCSDNTEAGINTYLDAMNQLELDYPLVTFIYMTGHLDGSGLAGNLYARNNQIRQYCTANSKVLFDFADIESWDPDGNYYPDESDNCSWCSVWCASHPCPSCGCAHSHCFNCYQKGKGFWWMMARVSGWDPTTAVQAASAPASGRASFLEQNYPNPFNPSTTIGFRLPAALHVHLEIFDVSGHSVAVLLDRRFGAGDHVIEWDGKDSTGRPVATGTYFCQLRAGDLTDTKKMTLLK
ncbi:MAG: T9SS type A sorting domain-containing protein [Candidatus Eisenbacteria sp.]|nr:T9SS type A sorting domain-containing protein [Candidatus Eisenbacteria bacterium]